MAEGDGQRASQRSMRAQSSRSAFSATSTHCVCDSAASSLTLRPAAASKEGTSGASGPGNSRSPAADDDEDEDDGDDTPASGEWR